MKFFLTLAFSFLLSFLSAQKLEIRNDSLFVTHGNKFEITNLDLSDYALSVLPKNLNEFSSVQVLDLSNNNLQSLIGLKELKQLLELKLDGNIQLKASSFNGEVNQLEKLQILSAKGCQLAFVPFDIYNVSSLKELNLSNNQIETISFELKKLKKLEQLNLANNQIQFIDNGLIGLGQLKSIDISHNAILNLPHLMYQLASLKNLESLSVDFDNYNEFDSKFVKLKSVKQLYLTNFNQFYSKSFVQLFNHLEDVYIQGNASIEDFNKLLTDLGENELSSLSISSNILSELPDNIALYRSLENLIVCFEELKTQPTFFNRMNSLLSLELILESFNMSSFMPSLITLNGIQNLTIESNEEFKVPETIFKLKSLNKLKLTTSELQELPLSLERLSDLKRVELNLQTSDVANLEKLEKEMVDCEFILNSKKVKEKKNGFSPPLENVNVDYERYYVDVTNPQLIQTISGTTLDIPQNAFLRPNGELVTGNVRIEYREFNDPIDMVFAGVPMMEEENGETYTFASAGMLEFRAYQNEEELVPNSENLITVNYNSPFSGTDYDLFELNPETEKWENLGKDSITEANLTLDTGLYMEPVYPQRPVFPTYPYRKQKVWINYKRYKRKKKQSRKNLPLTISSGSKRTRRDTNNKVYSEFRYLNKLKFKVDYNSIDQEEFNDLNDLLDEIFQFNKVANRVRTNRNTSFGWGYLNSVEDITLEPNTERDNFDLLVIKSGEEVRIPVEPVNLPNKAEVAQKRLERYYARYKQKLNQRKNDWKVVEKSHEKEIIKYREDLKQYEEYLEEYRAQVLKMNERAYTDLKTYSASEQNVIRSFSLTGFGTFNCDIRGRMQDPKPLLAQLQNQEGSNLHVNKIYILDKSNNGVLDFNNLKDVFFDSENINCLIAILPNSKIGVLKSENFDPNILSRKRNAVPLEVFNMDSISVEELREYANFF